MLTSVLGVNGEFVDLVGSALLESLTPGLDLRRVAFADHQFEWRVSNMFSVLENVHPVLAYFIWREQDSCGTFTSSDVLTSNRHGAVNNILRS